MDDKIIVYGYADNDDLGNVLVPLQFDLDLNSGKTGISTIASARNQLFDGRDYISQWQNTPANPLTQSDGTVFPAAARTGSINSQRLNNYNHRGAHFVTNITSIAPGAGITVTIQGYHPLANVYYDLLQGPTYTTTGIKVLKIYPGIASVPNAAASDILPRVYRLSVTTENNGSINYSIGQNKVV